MAPRRVRTGTFLCPHCAERVDTWPDPGSGLEQDYVEDCPVCCRPNRLIAQWDEDAGGYVITAYAEE